jgi:signal transduction histidine kinase
MKVVKVIGSALRAPLSSRTWREVGYSVASLLPAIPAFALALLGVVASALSIVVVGIPVLAIVLALARSTGRMFRGPARAILGWDWATPRPLEPTGPIRALRAVLRDAPAWRALLYGLVKFPLTAITVYGTAIAIVAGTFGLAAPLWWLASHDGWGILNSNSWSSTVGLAVQGAAVLLVFPWFVRFLVGVDRALVSGLLAPTRDSQRVAALERSRAILTEDAAAVLARIERDLHDGTQARFVTLGMTLSRLERRIDDPVTRDLVTSARTVVDDGLNELRDIIRRMHPPALDDGLPTALATLASRNPVPTELHDRLRASPSPAAATAIYFTAAELLANVTRHAAASRADVTVEDTETAFVLTVTDDGHGGATTKTASGSGLAGLQRRAEALDGAFHIDSPPGGSTTVTMTLPKEP